MITLPAGPLLELVCLASRRQLTAMWLSLATILIGQLNPPPSIFLPTNNSSVKGEPTVEAQTIVGSALPVLMECSLGMLGAPGAMENVFDFPLSLITSLAQRPIIIEPGCGTGILRMHG